MKLRTLPFAKRKQKNKRAPFPLSLLLIKKLPKIQIYFWLFFLCIKGRNNLIWVKHFSREMSIVLFSFVSVLFCLLLNGIQGQLTNVKVALFRDNNWLINVNYLSANSSSFWREYILKADCETVLKFQEVYCLGKSINITIKDLFDSQKIYLLDIKSQVGYNCSSNVQDPDVAALDPLYSKGEIVLPKGVYSINMRLDDYENVLGFRGYAVKASVTLDRLILSRKCRSRHNPNNSP